MINECIDCAKNQRHCAALTKKGAWGWPCPAFTEDENWRDKLHVDTMFYRLFRGWHREGELQASGKSKTFKTSKREP